MKRTKLSHILLGFLFFSAPLVHTKVLDTVWLPLGLSVDWNFEFTKVMFFQFLSGITLFVFCIETLKNKQYSPLSKNQIALIGITLLILGISTLFSLSPYHSFWWNGDKSHSFLMYVSLVWIFLMLKNSSTRDISRLISICIVALVCVCLLSLKEYFFPTFSYGELSSRAIGTFGHPNYLALYILMMLPLVFERVFTRPKKSLFIFVLILSIVTLILTKSIWGIVIWTTYITWLSLSRIHFLKKYTRWVYLSIVCSIVIVGIALYYSLPPEKLHSFLSRWYIWTTTVHIILSDIQIFVFWGWLESLPIYFNTFKSPELYIFENFWYTADRPHNFLLYVLYHWWVWALIIFVSLLIIWYKKIRHTWVWTPQSIVLIFLWFCVFNYPSIWTYLLLILALSSPLFSSSKKTVPYQWWVQKILLGGISVFAIVGVFTAFSQYRSELLVRSWDIQKAAEVFPLASYWYQLWETETWKHYDPLPSEKYYQSYIQDFENISENCELLVTNFPSAENYLYCGGIFKRLNQEQKAKEYYSLGIQKLPDLWNPDSAYWDSYFVKTTITGNRFFSEKFGDINEVLEYLQ